MFEVLLIRTHDAADSTMYPTLGVNVGEIAFEPEDGSNVTPYRANGVAINEVSGDRTKLVASLRDVIVNVFVTDSRVAMAIPKWDTGGGWRSTSLTTMAVLNTVSHVRAAGHRRGKLLVGHVRYPWISQVGHSAKLGMGETNRLRFSLTDANDGMPRTLLVDLAFPKAVETASIAADIAQRAARYRLTSGEAFHPDEQAKFEALTAAVRLPNVASKFAFHTMPAFLRASPANARHGSTSGATNAATATPDADPQPAGGGGVVVKTIVNRSAPPLPPPPLAQQAPPPPPPPASPLPPLPVSQATVPYRNRSVAGRSARFCTGCGTALTTGQAFCTKCGTAGRH